MIGECQDYLTNVIFTLVAERLVRKGCEAYFTFISDSTSTKITVNYIRTIRDFLNFFR